MTRTKTVSGGAGCLAVVGVIAVIVALWAAITAVTALILAWAWNLVVPSTFGGPTLDFGAAFALVLVVSILGRLLFGGRSSSK